MIAWLLPVLAVGSVALALRILLLTVRYQRELKVHAPGAWEEMARSPLGSRSGFRGLFNVWIRNARQHEDRGLRSLAASISLKVPAAWRDRCDRIANC